ncbi:LuxR C-terminal-related transcriptional regulator [Pseudonocardia yuanmonensis]|uniref:LuxR C-terminal-related transcriptional regulator n=1 Tax=Pseudonocardia yuanmonensis TaxID=1095914 RepID=UPI0031F17F81
MEVGGNRDDSRTGQEDTLAHRAALMRPLPSRPGADPAGRHRPGVPAPRSSHDVSPLSSASAAPDPWPLRHRHRVLPSKTSVPAVSERFVPRRHLHTLLDVAADRPVTLLSAPAGYGKTQTVADWVRRSVRFSGVAWVTVDRDDDATSVWAALLEAFCGCAGLAADDERRELVDHASDEQALLAELLDILAVLDGPVLLVLDDLHEIATSRSLHVVEMLLRHQPEFLHLVLAARHDPPLGLARMRLDDRLAEIRSGDLRFDADSAALLLRRAGVDLDRHRVEVLVARTEGWAAGLRLAALSLNGAPSPEHFFEHFLGQDQAVADYLIGEVLGRLPADLLDFLRILAVCSPMPTELAARLSGRSDAAALLERLERETALVTGDGPGRWSYRIHTLLRAYLGADLDRVEPGRRQDLHRLAARWFEGNHDLSSAVEHAAAGRDTAQITAQLHRYGVALLLAGHADHLATALRALPSDRVDRDPWLALLAAVVALNGEHPGTAEVEVEHARRAWPRNPTNDLVVLRALVEGEVAAALRHPVQPPATGPDTHPLPEQPALEAWTRADRARAHVLTNALGDADHEFEHARGLAERHGLDSLELRAMVGEAVIKALRGDYVGMAERATEALTKARRTGPADGPMAAAAHLMQASADLVGLRPNDALTRLASARSAIGPRNDPWLSATIESFVAVAEFDRARRSASDAAQVLHRTRLLIGPDLPLAEWTLGLAVLEHELADAAHDRVLARDVVAWCRAHLECDGDAAVLRARSLLRQDRTDQARESVLPVLDGELVPVLPASTVHAWLVRAAAAHHAGQHFLAREDLAEALAAAAPHGLIRPFRYADPALLTILIRQRGSFGPAEQFLDVVLDGLGTLDTAAYGTPADLTDRERTVLSQLRTHRSLDEIAGDLMVSTNTVKTHVRAIYRKLDVNSRRAAIIAAEEARLL